MRALIVVVGLTVALAGCQEARRQQALAEAAPQHDAYCRSLGTKPGESAYVQCRLAQGQELGADARQRRLNAAIIYNGM